MAPHHLEDRWEWGQGPLQQGFEAEEGLSDWIAAHHELDLWGEPGASVYGSASRNRPCLCGSPNSTRLSSSESRCSSPCSVMVTP